MQVHKKRTLFDILNIMGFVIFTLMCVYPFYFILINSLSNAVLAERQLILLWPAGFTFENFKKVFQMPDIKNAAFISISRTVLGTGLCVIFSTFFAYLMTKQELPGRKIIYRFMVLTMYINAGLIPTYLLYKSLGLTSTFWVYIIPPMLNAWNVVLVKTFIEQLPASLEEAAMIDGAGAVVYFFKILLPVITSVVATTVVFGAVAAWNSWFDNFIYANTKSLKTLQLLLLDYLNNISKIANADRFRDIMNMEEAPYQLTPTAVRMTITMIVTLPILFVYPLLQKYFVKGIMLGSIKG